MNIILFTATSRRARSINLGRARVLIPLMALVVCTLGATAHFGFSLGHHSGVAQAELSVEQSFYREVSAQRQALRETRDGMDRQLNALALRLGKMQAQLIRLDALGDRLASVAELDEGEFNFGEPPGLGGPLDAGEQRSAALPELAADLEDLYQRLEDRERQLGVMEALLVNRNLRDRSYPAGRPIVNGWLSSYFGSRADPFTGRSDYHRGVDFAGKLGGDVVAVAAGVVTQSGWESGYGRMVEIDHGNGYVTRYGHNSQNLVQVGDTVKKGQNIAAIGNSGRSTGPHVHFEVLSHGKVVNPSRFIQSRR